MNEKEKVARPEGLEPPTLCFEGRCSIQLSYGRVTNPFYPVLRASARRSIRNRVSGMVPFHLRSIRPFLF